MRQLWEKNADNVSRDNSEAALRTPPRQQHGLHQNNHERDSDDDVGQKGWPTSTNKHQIKND